LIFFRIFSFLQQAGQIMTLSIWSGLPSKQIHTS